MNLEGQVAWLTGASSGIGEALAYALNSKGVNLVLSARHRDRLEAVQGRCNPTRGGVSVLPFDLEQIDRFPAIADEALTAFGHIDILVDNGGLGQFSAASETGIEVDERLMRVNYLAQVALTKAVLPRMIARKRGMIVVISSLAGQIGTPGRSSYSGSKHALHGFFDSLRAEVWRDGIRVLIVLPGWVKTNFRASALGADGKPRGAEDRPYSNALSAEECAREIVKAIEKEKEEVYIGRTGYSIYARRLFPGLFSQVLRRVMRS